MKKNNQFLTKLWIPVIILVVIVGAGIIKETIISPLFLLIPIAVAFIFIGKKKQSNGNVKKSLQEDNPTKLINTIAKPLKSIPQKNIKECYMTYNTALSYLLYGKYDEAKQIMSKVNWESKEPMFQALNLNIKSLDYYFKGEIQLGLTNARQAKALATTSSAFPGAQKSIDLYDAYIGIGHILAGVANDNQIISSLENEFTKQPLIPQLIIAWGLINAYKVVNDFVKQERMVEFCKDNAPHCTDLIRLINNNPNLLNAKQEDINFA